jgi:polyisoprenoid-binding protein YceI
MSKRTRTFAGLSLLAILLVGAAATWFLLIRDDGPEAATSASAVEAARQQHSDSTTDEEKPTASDVSDSVDETWMIDTSFGDNEFPFDGNTYVGYRVVEELASIGGFTAVGRSTVVSGSLTIEGTQITAVDVLADLTRLKSDTTARDEIIRSQALESATFPEASFALVEPIELDQIPANDETIKTDAVGELTLHGVSNRITVQLEATLVGDDTIVVVGRIPIQFDDFDIEPPSAAIVLSIEDEGEIELQLFFTR